MGGWGSWAPVTAESSARPPPLVTLGSPAPTPYGPREHKALPAGSLERHWFGDRPLAHYAAAPHPLVGFPLPKRGAGGPGRPLDPPLRVRPLLIWSPRDTRRGWGAGPGAGGLPARPFSVPTPPAPVAQRSGRGYLERSWLEPRLSTGEMLAECRRAACLLGEAGCEPALDLVRDRERRFFFFSWGLLEGKRF